MATFTDYQVLTIKEPEDVTLYVVYSEGYYTLYGTRRYLDREHESDIERVDFYRSFHYCQFEVMLAYIKFMFNDFKENVEIAQNVISAEDTESVHDYTVDDLFYMITSKNEIFGYDSFKVTDFVLKNLLGSIFYY